MVLPLPMSMLPLQSAAKKFGMRAFCENRNAIKGPERGTQVLCIEPPTLEDIGARVLVPPSIWSQRVPSTLGDPPPHDLNARLVPARSVAVTRPVRIKSVSDASEEPCDIIIVSVHPSGLRLRKASARYWWPVKWDRASTQPDGSTFPLRQLRDSTHADVRGEVTRCAYVLARPYGTRNPPFCFE
jgi:hypothetical protein